MSLGPSKIYVVEIDAPMGVLLLSVEFRPDGDECVDFRDLLGLFREVRERV